MANVDHRICLSRPYAGENIKNITDQFLKRECQHSESLHPSKKRYDFIFRERSIDDGSHFDPRLDKYPEPRQPKRMPNADLSPDKKTSSLKKVSHARVADFASISR